MSSSDNHPSLVELKDVGDNAIVNVNPEGTPASGGSKGESGLVENEKEEQATPTPQIRTSTDFDHYLETHSRLFRSRRTIAIIQNISHNKDERSWRQKLYLIMEHPRSSYVAMVATIISSLMTVIQTVCLILRSFPFFFQFEFMWLVITGTLSVYFMIEYFLRMLAYVYSWGDFRHFITGAMNIIDFLSFISFWIDLVLYEAQLSEHFYAQTLTVFRILRLLKLIKLTRLSAKFQLLVVSIRRSFELLISLTVLTFMGALISSTLIYYAERGLYDSKSGTWLRPDGTPTPFSNIMVCMWFSIVSLATVGYGDITPITVTGRIIAIMTILSGIMIMALPSMAVGGIYSKLLGEFDAELERRQKENEGDFDEDFDVVDEQVEQANNAADNQAKEHKSWLSVDDLLFGGQSNQGTSSFGDLGDWSNLNTSLKTRDLSQVDDAVLGKLIQQQELLMQACVQQMDDMKIVVAELQRRL